VLTRDKTVLGLQGLMVEDILLDFLYGMVIAGLQCASGRFQHLAHLVVGHLIVIPEVEDNSLFFRELLDG
jgi:hypothetical protein